jgi:putative salt-induced outer membrane protein YdiY
VKYCKRASDYFYKLKKYSTLAGKHTLKMTVANLMMNKALLSSSLFSSLLLLPSLSLAEDVNAAASWSGNAELGFIQTSGNSDTQSFNGKFNLVRELDPTVTSFKLEALTSEEEGTSSKERYLSELKYDYSLGEFSYVTSILLYEDDRFNGYQYQSTLAVGYGYRVWHGEQGELDLEVGPGYRRNALEVSNEYGSKIEEETIGRASLNLLIKISDNAEFTETLTVEGGDSKVVYKSDMGIQSTLIGQLAMKINYQVKHTTNVPEDKKKTDSLVGVTLVYSF